jgi:hypothetical protein
VADHANYRQRGPFPKSRRRGSGKLLARKGPRLM